MYSFGLSSAGENYGLSFENPSPTVWCQEQEGIEARLPRKKRYELCDVPPGAGRGRRSPTFGRVTRFTMLAIFALAGLDRVNCFLFVASFQKIVYCSSNELYWGIQGDHGGTSVCRWVQPIIRSQALGVWTTVLGDQNGVVRQARPCFFSGELVQDKDSDVSLTEVMDYYFFVHKLTRIV